MALPIVHHRSPDFRPTYRQVLDRLKDVYRTQAEVLLYTASGTAGLESVVANLTSPGDRVGISAGTSTAMSVRSGTRSRFRYRWLSRECRPLMNGSAFHGTSQFGSRCRIASGWRELWSGMVRNGWTAG